MNKIMRLPQPTSYESDYALWCSEQGALLRRGKLDALDRENLAEEIESLGRSDKREIDNRLKVLLVHLLKRQFQPGKDKSGWTSTIVEQRRRIQKVINESPSLKAYPASVLAEEYRFAREEAAEETGIVIDTFPAACPYTITQVLNLNFDPSAR